MKTRIWIVTVCLMAFANVARARDPKTDTFILEFNKQVLSVKSKADVIKVLGEDETIKWLTERASKTASYKDVLFDDAYTITGIDKDDPRAIK
jgi:hypothetical protein